MVAGIWVFTPNEIHVPAGSTVTFVATSRDVVHGRRSSIGGAPGLLSPSC